MMARTGQVIMVAVAAILVVLLACHTCDAGALLGRVIDTNPRDRANMVKRIMNSVNSVDQCLWQMAKCDPYGPVHCCSGMKCANYLGGWCSTVEKCYCLPRNYGGYGNSP